MGRSSFFFCFVSQSRPLGGGAMKPKLSFPGKSNSCFSTAALQRMIRLRHSTLPITDCHRCSFHCAADHKRLLRVHMYAKQPPITSLLWHLRATWIDLIAHSSIYVSLCNSNRHPSSPGAVPPKAAVQRVTPPPKAAVQPVNAPVLEEATATIPLRAAFPQSSAR